MLVKYHDKFQCINGIQSQTVTEERGIVVNVFRGDFLEVKGIDNLLLEFVDEFFLIILSYLISYI